MGLEPGTVIGAGKASALHRFSACGRSATVLYLHFIHFCNLKRCRPHKKIKKLHSKISNHILNVNVNIKMLEKWKIIMYVFATLLQPASLSGTVHL